MESLGESLECFDYKAMKCRYWDNPLKMPESCKIYPYSRGQILEGCGYYWETD